MEPDISNLQGGDAPVALALVERDSGSLAAVNDEFCALFDLDRDVLVGRPLSWLTAPSWSPDVALSDRLSSVSADETTQFTFPCRDGANGRFCVDASLTVAESDTDYAVLACHDVSEYRDKEAELEYRTALLEAQAEATIDGFLVVNEDREIVFYNSQFLDILDIPEAVVEGGSDRHAIDAITDKLADPEAFRQHVDYLQDHPGEESHDEVRLTDGRWLDRFSAPVVGGDGTVYGRLWVIRDVTDRKDREQRLQEFASVVSHDLRNPLDVAIGRIDILDDVGEVPDDLRPHIEEVDSSLHRMARLIDDLLTLTKQGGNVSETEALDLASLAEDAWGNVATDDASLVIETELTVEVDGSRLVQLLENLFRNAIEHGGDAVTVTIGNLDGTTGDAGFYVADDGPGIPPEEREQVFDYGYTTSAEGTGFGLAIVTDIARGHDWRTDVTASESGGARFEFYTG